MAADFEAGVIEQFLKSQAAVNEQAAALLEELQPILDAQREVPAEKKDE